MKRLTAILLTLAMVVSLCVVFATAEGSKNLALGCDVTGAEPSSHTANANYGGKLTDGNAADGSAIGTKDEWFCYYQNPDAKPETWNTTDTENRIGVAVIDLKAVCTVENVRVHLFTGNHWGIIAPKSVTVSVSENGTDYTKVGVKEYEKIETENMMEEWSEFKLATAAAARYVKVEVALNGNFAFLNEIEVIGVEGAPAAPAAEDFETEILVSHRNLYNWPGSFEDVVVIKGYYAWGQDKPVNNTGDVPQGAGQPAEAYNGCILYVVEPKDGKYVITKQVDSLSGTYDCPEEGFLLVVSPKNGNYAKVEGKDLVGAVVEVPDAVFASNFSIDTKQGGVAHVLKVTKKAPAQGGEVETVKEVIAVDGKLNDTGWVKAEWQTKGAWQYMNPETNPMPAMNAAYALRSDDENVYLAVKADMPWQYKEDEYQTGATNFRIWFLGDKGETRNFFDVTLNAEKNGFNTYLFKQPTDKITVAADLESETIAAEFVIKKADLLAEGSLKFMVTVSNPEVVDGDKKDYNAYHLTNVTPDTTNGAWLKDWSGNDSLYRAWSFSDIALGEYVVEPEADDDYSALLGTPNADPAFDVELTANAETYKVGDTVKVTLTVKSEKQFSGVSLKLNYDKAKVEALVKNNEEDGNADMAAFVTAEGWEAVCSLDEENGCYNLSFVNEESTADELVINVEFKVVAGAEGDVVFYVAHSDATVDVYAEGALFPETLAGNGSYAVVKEAAPAPGDAGVIMLVVLSVVAALGCAVVVKATR